MSNLIRITVVTTVRSIVLATFAAATTAAASDAHASSRNALREIVQGECLVHWLQHQDPAPCERVYLTDAQARDGYAVLADIKGGAHFLLIPLKTISGIESPEVLESEALNYFAAAWQARDRLAAVLGHGVRRGDVGLAVNPKHGRGQDQLHIHIECLGVEVHGVLHAAAERLYDHWSSINVAGRPYQALRVMGEDLGTVNPFGLLAQRLPGAGHEMGTYTLMVAGMQFKEGPGFIVLAGKDVPGAELFLDSTCALASDGREGKARQ
jgi:CDP-diacylglycerol pyrophosphatase